MKIPFDTHTIYITLDKDTIYKLNPDLTKEIVTELPIPSPENPIMLLHKSIFDCAKDHLLDINNPFRIDNCTAVEYNKIGFISDKELDNFLSLT